MRRMDRDEDQPVQILRQRQRARDPCRRQQVVRLVDQQPVRPPGSGTQLQYARQQRSKKRRPVAQRQPEQIDYQVLFLLEQLQSLVDAWRPLSVAQNDGALKALVVSFGVKDAELILLLLQALQQGGGDGRFTAAGWSGNEQLDAIGGQADFVPSF